MPREEGAILAPGMRHIIESLSPGSGAGIVALLSAFLTWLLFRLVRGREVWLLPLAVPLPVWMGAEDGAQFEAWAGLFITPWYLAGAGASEFAVLLLRSLRK